MCGFNYSDACYEREIRLVSPAFVLLFFPDGILQTCHRVCNEEMTALTQLALRLRLVKKTCSISQLSEQTRRSKIERPKILMASINARADIVLVRNCHW
jgi:hypothetical protein